MIKTHDYTSKSYSSFSQLCSFCKCKNPLTVKPPFQLKKTPRARTLQLSKWIFAVALNSQVKQQAKLIAKNFPCFCVLISRERKLLLQTERNPRDTIKK